MRGWEVDVCDVPLQGSRGAPGPVSPKHIATYTNQHLFCARHGPVQGDLVAVKAQPDLDHAIGDYDNHGERQFSLRLVLSDPSDPLTGSRGGAASGFVAPFLFFIPRAYSHAPACPSLPPELTALAVA